MRLPLGFTLLEVVVAGGLMAMGILALVTLQAQALQAQRRVGTVRHLVGVAEAELDRRLAQAVPAAGACSEGSAGPSPIVSCLVEVEGCAESQSGLCAETDSARAARVVVTVEAVEGRSFELAAIHARFPRQ